MIISCRAVRDEKKIESELQSTYGTIYVTYWQYSIGLLSASLSP